MFVVFTSVTEFLIIAMYTRGVPMAEHDNLKPGNTRATGPGNTTFGETKKINNSSHLIKSTNDYVQKVKGCFT